MKNTEGIHNLVRAVITHDAEVLLTTDIARNVSFLPGGHIHHGEKAPDALLRELKEELGIAPTIGPYLATVESSWDYHGELYHEYNLIFQIALDQATKANIRQIEPNLAVEWCAIEKLHEKNIFPRLLKTQLAIWLRSTSTSHFHSEWTDRESL